MIKALSLAHTIFHNKFPFSFIHQINFNYFLNLYLIVIMMWKTFLIFLPLYSFPILIFFYLHFMFYTDARQRFAKSYFRFPGKPNSNVLNQRQPSHQPQRLTVLLIIPPSTFSSFGFCRSAEWSSHCFTIKRLDLKWINN